MKKIAVRKPGSVRLTSTAAALYAFALASGACGGGGGPIIIINN